MNTKQALEWGGGTQVKLAQRLGCTQAAVQKWDEFPPAEQQLRIQLLSDGELKAEPWAVRPKMATG
jgi:hypothetical protein